MSGAPPPGWYADPALRWERRWWDGSAWAPVVLALDPPRGSAGAEVEAAHLAYVHGFVDSAVRLGRVEPRRADVLHRMAAEREAALQAASPARRPATPRPVPARRPVAAPRPAAAPASAAPRSAPVAAPAPPLRGWLGRWRRRVAADLAVNGLAYLGVLLVLAGVVGTLVFGFESLSPQQRVLLELALPVTFLSAAAFLHRVGAPYVGSGFEVVGGVTLPLVVVASFVDGVPFPPDPDTGAARVITLTVVTVLLAAAAASLAWRRPRSPLVHLAAPILWLAVGLAGLATHPSVPVGSAVAVPRPAQVALVALSVPVTLLLVRLPVPAALRRATESMALPGLAVVAVLQAGATASAGWRSAPVVLTLLAGLATVELTGSRWGPRVTAWAELALVSAGVLALAPEVPAAWQGVVGVVALLALTEVTGARRPGTAVIRAQLGATALALLVAGADAWPAVTGWTAAALWGLVRRRSPVRWLSRGPVDLAAALGPAGAYFALGAAVPTLAWVVLGGAAVVLAVALLERLLPGVLREVVGGAPTLWVLVAGGFVAVSSLAEAAAAVSPAPAWLCALATILVASAVATSRAPVPARAWGTVGAGVAAVWIVVVPALDVEPGWSSASIAIAGAVVTLVAISGVRPHDWAAHLGAAGLLLAGAATLHVAVVSVLDAPEVTVEDASGWVGAAATGPSVAALAALTVASATLVIGTVVVPTSSSLIGPQTPSVVLAVALPGLGVTAAVQSGLLPAGDDRLAAAAAGASLLLVALARSMDRLAHGQEPAATPVTAAATALAHGAVAVAGVAALAGLATTGGGTVALAVTVAAVVALGLLRLLVEEAAGWLLTAPLAVHLAELAGVPASDVHLVLLGWGCVVTVAALLVAGGATSTERRHRLTQRPALLAAMLAGTVAVAVGWAFTTADGRTTTGLASLAVALWSIVLVGLSGLAQVGLVTWTAGVLATAFLVPEPLGISPWTCAVTTAVLLGVSVALDWRGQGRHVPYPVAVAHLTALATLLLPDTAAEMAGTWMLVGALTVAGGAWWRSHGRRTWAAAYALGGTAVLLVGLAVVGPGWDVVALVLGAVVAAVTAHLADGSGRVVAAATAAALTITAWLVALDRLDTPVLTGAAATCVLAGVATVGTAAGSRWLRVRDAVPAAVGSLSCAVVLAAAVLVTDLVLRPGDPELLAPAAGLGLAAAAAIRLATPTGWPWVREVAALLVVGAAGHLGAAVYASPAVAVVSASFIALLVALAGAVRWAAHPGSPWARPAIVGATGLLALAAVSAAGEPDLLAVVLLDATAVLAVIGLVGQRSIPLLVAPVPAVLGWWLLVVTHLPGADPAWYAVPSGAAVLTFVAVLRWHRRAQGLDPAAAPVVVLDLLGMAVLVTPSLLASATSAVQAVLTVALGVTLGTYGVLSQVRRRVVVGAATVLLAVSAVVVPPLVGLLPRWEGPQLWLALLAAGLTALAAATMIERRRGGVRASVAALRALTASWE